MFKSKANLMVNDIQAKTKQEIKEATKNLAIANDNFNNADLNYFDIANSELTIAKEKLNLVYKKAKKL